MKNRIVYLLFLIVVFAQISLAAEYNTTVHKAQQRLTALGFNPGVVDGLWGRNTQRAVKAYQQAKGLPLTGILDHKTLQALGQTTIPVSQNPYPWLSSKYDIEHSIRNRIKVPTGYERTKVPKNSFQHWLRGLPLKKDSTVYLYNGRKKPNQTAQYAVVDIDTGQRDLQQCADAAMRLKAEYLFSIKDFSNIHFKFTSGHVALYSKWRKGYRPKVKGNNVQWVITRRVSPSYSNFRKYLDTVFIYAGSYSLSKEMLKINIADMTIGDVFITGGFPGHAVIVVDVAIHKTTGKKLFLLAQSYMPAQDIHILNNPGDNTRNPWYNLDFGQTLQTPEWTFSAKQLKRFK